MTKKGSNVLRIAIARALYQWSPVIVATAVVPFETSLADCGPHVPGEQLVCNASGNPYTDGIVYDVTADLDLLLESSVIIQRPAGFNFDGVDVFGDDHTFNVTAEDGVTINVSGEESDGIAVTATRNITIDSGANITAERTGLRGYIKPGGAGAVDITQRQGSAITITGIGSGLYALNEGTGSATATSAGTIEASNVDDVYGLTAYASSGGATTVLTETGVVNLSGARVTGLYSLNGSGGAANTQARSAGRIDITGDDTAGVVAFAHDTANEGSVLAELIDGGTITMNGEGAYGLWSYHQGLGAATARSAGTIATTGDVARGIVLNATNPANSALLEVAVTGEGSVETSGARASAIHVDGAGTGPAIVRLLSNASLTTHGPLAHGVNAVAGGAVSLLQSATSTIAVAGAEAIGASLGGEGATLEIGGAVSATGEYGVGAIARGGPGSAEQVIAASATITGGWQSDVAGAGSNLGYSAAGVMLEGDLSAHLFNEGTIHAGSDRAVVARGGDVTIDNLGHITGFVELSGTGAIVFNNESSETFELRHFADTDGDGVRDTKRVAISDFGSPTSVFNNTSNGLLKLGVVENELFIDSTGYYVPTTGVDSRPLSGYELDRPGVVQGQLVNLGTFHHAGVIDLRGPAIGNSLVITGAPAAGGAPGDGVFVSNGGSLLVNVVLNEGLQPGGQSGSLADVLVVDGTQLGSGPTTITVDRKEGGGALTPGNGILLVEVRDKARSAPGVFALDSDFTQNGLPSIVAGAYAYSLFHNGTDSDAADGNWYLRSSMADLTPTDPTDPSDPTDPTDPTGPTDPTSPVSPPSGPPPSVDPAAPRFQPGVPLYESYAANLHALNLLPTLQQRVGNRVWNVDENLEPTGAWGRTYGATTRSRAGHSTAGVDQTVDAWKLQLGFERLVRTSERGRLVGSVAVEYGQSDGTVHSIFGDGRIDTEGYGLGTMWTWYGHQGTYVDGQLQLNRYNTDLQSALLGELAHDHNGRGTAASVEIGKKVRVSEVWSVTPQMQHAYSKVRFDRFVDPAGAVVSTDDADSLTSRFGLAINRDHVQEDRRSLMYWIANLSFEWGDGLRTYVSGVPVERKDRKQWLELGFGGSVERGERLRVYGELSGKSPWRDFGDSYTVHATAGLSVRF